MNFNKNIDQLFQEKLKDFEVSPPDSVWEGIEQQLNTIKPKPRFPLWLLIGSVASILVILTIGGVNYFSNSSTNIHKDVVTDIDISNPNINKKNVVKDALNSNENTITEIVNETKDTHIKSTVENKKHKSELQINTKNKQQQATQNTITNIQSKKEIHNNLEQTTTLLHKNKLTINLSSNTKEKKSADFDRTVEKNIFNKKTVKNIANKDDLKESKSTPSHKNEGLENESDIAKVENKPKDVETKKIKEVKKVEISKKWSVATVIAPITYNSFNTKGSPLDIQFENNSKQGSKTMSYGLKIGFKINKKLSLQSGVTLVDVAYKIQNVFVNPSNQGFSKLSNVKYSKATNILSVQSRDVPKNVRLETDSSISEKGVLNQEFGYIEIPLELKYKINNSKKIGVNLIGGFSALVLNKNEVYVETSEFSSSLGEADNLNKVNFSGNFGIDVDYKINRSLYLNVAPMLKIHTSTFSKNETNFKPYILGIYTGLNYKF